MFSALKMNYHKNIVPFFYNIKKSDTSNNFHSSNPNSNSYHALEMCEGVKPIEKVEIVEWGQFIELDNNTYDIFSDRKKMKKYGSYSKKTIHSCLEKIEEEKEIVINIKPLIIEEGKNNKGDSINENTNQIENENNKKIWIISLPFTNKKMMLHCNKKILVAHFSFSIISMTIFLLTFYL